MTRVPASLRVSPRVLAGFQRFSIAGRLRWCRVTPVASEDVVRSTTLRLLTGLAAGCLLGGCATAPVRPSAYLPPQPRAVVFVADGAGGDLGTSRALVAATRESGLPLYI